MTSLNIRSRFFFICLFSWKHDRFISMFFHTTTTNHNYFDMFITFSIWVFPKIGVPLNKTIWHDLVLKPMVTWGSPILRTTCCILTLYGLIMSYIILHPICSIYIYLYTYIYIYYIHTLPICVPQNFPFFCSPHFPPMFSPMELLMFSRSAEAWPWPPAARRNVWRRRWWNACSALVMGSWQPLRIEDPTEKGG